MSDIVERLAASLAGRYEIGRELGVGGMATVYVARDVRHGRDVALKVMRPDLGGGLGVDRFLREIQVAAGLQHPHIVPVFDSGVEGRGSGSAEILWYTMPLVEGEALRRRIQRERQLPVADAFAIAAEVADALGYAHGRGVIHRDVKPENILLSGGHALVADFGVAKALGANQAPEAPLTRAGLVVGTPYYMSPEQATGSDQVDARSDQYSLACVLYEMLVGEPPFVGTGAGRVMSRALTARRPKASRVRPEVGPGLDAAIQRAMAIDPAERFPDMSAFEAALREAHGASAGPPARRRALVLGAAIAAVAAAAGAWFATHLTGHIVEPAAARLAVLPFSTTGASVDFLREGMVDLLSTNLTGVGGISAVDARTVLHKAGRSGATVGLERAIDLARDLGAGSVVLGSAVGAGGQVRLTADLYSVAGERLGRARVDGPVDSVLPLVDRLSLALLRDVWRSREPIPAVRLASQTTDSLDALRAYLQGEQFYRRLAFDSAELAYDRAVEVDSTFALAHFRRALAYGWTEGYGNATSREATAAGTRFARKLPPRERRLLAAYRLFERGKRASVDSVRQFLKQYPEDLDGWYVLGEALYHTREFTGVSPDSISSAFDRVVQGDSGLVPALLHPAEVALVTRDSARFDRYFPVIARSAPDQGKVLRTYAAVVWGPLPADRAVRSLRGLEGNNLMTALLATYPDETATSDTVLGRFRWALRLLPSSPEMRIQALKGMGRTYVGLGRLEAARAVSDTLVALGQGDAGSLLGWPILLGLAPRSFDRGRLDSLVAAVPSGAERAYLTALLALVRGRPDEARRQVDGLLAGRDTSTPALDRGQMMAAQGYLMMLDGDSVAGIRRLTEGLDTAAAPGVAPILGFYRFQLALALAGRPATRRQGIQRLRNSFVLEPMFLPLTYLALGRAWEAAGERDSAAVAYGRFIRLWDKADPELQGRVQEARNALERLTAEPH